MKDRLAYSYRASMAILESMGFTEDQIINYIQNAVKPAEGYVYIDKYDIQTADYENKHLNKGNI